jgi:hypothetical protein
MNLLLKEGVVLIAAALRFGRHLNGRIEVEYVAGVVGFGDDFAFVAAQ